VAADDPHEPVRKTEFDREAWRRGLTTACSVVSAEKERLDVLDIDRMVAGLGGVQQIEEERGGRKRWGKERERRDSKAAVYPRGPNTTWSSTVLTSGTAGHAHALG
jgi:hypothetical protein